MSTPCTTLRSLIDALEQLRSEGIPEEIGVLIEIAPGKSVCIDGIAETETYRVEDGSDTDTQPTLIHLHPRLATRG